MKKWRNTILAVLLSLSLTSCGSTRGGGLYSSASVSSDTTDNEKESTVNTATKATADAATPTPTPTSTPTPTATPEPEPTEPEEETPDENPDTDDSGNYYTDDYDVTTKSVEEILARMSTKQKLAQMMIVSPRGNIGSAYGLSGAFYELISDYDFGGIIFFATNISSAEQTIYLVRDCQSAALDSRPGVPMFTCLDQEGGLVTRVSFGTNAPGNMALAATGDVDLTEEMAGILGSEIKALGFNTDFAPVSDVNNNPANPIIGIRSFSDDPEVTADNVVAYIEGLDDYNICSTLKHFPGHGNVGEDSHTGLPCSWLTKDELKSCELIPFKAGIDAGADMIMTAHIQYPYIESETYISKKDGAEVYLPATLSHTIITGLLRNELGFDGVIMTDAMEMAAISAHFDDIDAATMAINAGVDMLLCPVDMYYDSWSGTFPEVESYLNRLEARVDSGEIDEDRLDESVTRILKLKKEKGIINNTLSESASSQVSHAYDVIASPEHSEREWAIAYKGLTVLKNDGNMIPLNGNNGRKTLVVIQYESVRSKADCALWRLDNEGIADADNITVMSLSDLANRGVGSVISGYDNIILISQSTTKDYTISDAINTAHSYGKKAVLISAGLPYDVAHYNDADAIICAYGSFYPNAAAAVCACFGQRKAEGVLPVNIPKINSDGSYSDEILYWREV